MTSYRDRHYLRSYPTEKVQYIFFQESYEYVSRCVQKCIVWRFQRTQNYSHTTFFDEVIGGETESKLFNMRTVYTTLSGHNNLHFDTFE